jgi:uncharacterized membrane protein
MFHRHFATINFMDLQNTFYLLGIIYMILGILMLVGIIVLLFYIKKKIGDIHDFVELRIDQLTNLSLKPVKRASDMVRDILSTSPSKKTRTTAARKR